MRRLRSGVYDDRGLQLLQERQDATPVPNVQLVVNKASNLALKPVLIPLFWYCAKTGALLFVWIWVRGTLPRFRYDQLMRFAWTFLFPVAVVNLLVTGLMVAWFAK